MNKSKLEDCDIAIYRTSQYASYEDAAKLGGTYKLNTTFGYDSTESNIINNCMLADCMAHRSACDDIRAIIYANGKRLEECFLADALDVIDNYLTTL
jgi:hypothetical protein